MFGREGFQIERRSRHQINPADCPADDICNRRFRIPKYICKPGPDWEMIPIGSLRSLFHLNNKKARRRSAAPELLSGSSQLATAADGTSR